MANENLYQMVKNKICDDIFKGVYDDGDRLPPERDLEERLGVSRVTVRRSLEILEQEHLIVREVGRGTRLTFENFGNGSDLDMIVLVAPARNPFFSEFIGRLQNKVWKENALLLYVEKPGWEELEVCLYRLYKRGLRNAVIWPEVLPVRRERLQRLRAMGMNMVFFDSDKGLPYADCVSLDNRRAIECLYDILKKEGAGNTGYIGWSQEDDSYSIRMREQAFAKLAGSGACRWKLKWKQEEENEELLRSLADKVPLLKLDSLICCDRDSGELALRIFREKGVRIRMATVDEIPDGKREGMVMYRQNLSEAVEQIFECLKRQCQAGKSWEPQLILIPGELA